MAHIEIKRKGKGVLTGRNCEVFVDGQRMAGATNFTFFVDAKGIAKAKIEMIVHSLKTSKKTSRTITKRTK
jgi:hypothetical protein